jgi:hypothetical protein
MHVLKFISILTVSALAACGGGQDLDSSGRGSPASLTYAPSGTEIKLSNTANGTVSETSITAGLPAGARGTYTRANGQNGSFYPGCWGCGGTMQIEEDKYAALWPLETGKEVSFLRTAPDGQKARVVIKVAGVQTVETPAGTFETYMLDGRVEHLNGPRYSAQVRAWWAPNPGWVVKAEGGDSQGSNLSSQVVELSRP